MAPWSGGSPAWRILEARPGRTPAATARSISARGVSNPAALPYQASRRAGSSSGGEGAGAAQVLEVGLHADGGQRVVGAGHRLAADEDAVQVLRHDRAVGDLALRVGRQQPPQDPIGGALTFDIA